MSGNPWTDPALACELTWREREALMSEDDWRFLVERALWRTRISDSRFNLLQPVADRWEK